MIVVLLIAEYALTCSYGQEYSFRDLETAIRLLDDLDVRKELEISEKQFQEVRKNTRDMRKRIAATYLKLRSKGIPAYDKALVDAKGLVEEGQAAVKGILIEAQIKRLFQIARQTNQFTELPSNGILKKEVASLLKTNKLAKSRVRAIEKEIDQKVKRLHGKYKDEMKALLEERDLKLKSLLNDEQSENYDEYFGEPFFKVLETYISSRVWVAREKTEQMMRELRQKKE